MNHLSVYIVCCVSFWGVIFMKKEGLRADPPLEIKAKGQIVCDQKENICHATEKAIATRGDLMVQGDRLTVVFNPPSSAGTIKSPQQTTPKPTPKRTPKRLEAAGHVIITLPERKASASEAFYDVADAHFVLKGMPKIETPETSLSSPLPLHYFDHKGVGIARNGLFIHSTHKCAIYANTLHVFFPSKTPQTTQRPQMTEKKAEKLTGEGNVLLVSQQHTCRAEHAEYDIPRQQVILRGAVKASDHQNFFQGEYALLSLGAKESITVYGQDPTLPSVVDAPQKATSRIKALLIPDSVGHKVKPSQDVPADLSKDLSSDVLTDLPTTKGA